MRTIWEILAIGWQVALRPSPRGGVMCLQTSRSYAPYEHRKASKVIPGIERVREGTAGVGMMVVGIKYPYRTG